MLEPRVAARRLAVVNAVKSALQIRSSDALFLRAVFVKFISHVSIASRAKRIHFPSGAVSHRKPVLVQSPGKATP